MAGLRGNELARAENMKATCGHGVRWSWERMCWGYTVVLRDPDSRNPDPVCLCRNCFMMAEVDEKIMGVIIHGEFVKSGELNESNT